MLTPHGCQSTNGFPVDMYSSLTGTRTHTPPHLLLNANPDNPFTQHTASALTHLGRGKVASCFLSVCRRVGWGGGGDRGGGGDEKGGGNSRLSIVTISRDRGRGTGREESEKKKPGKGELRRDIVGNMKRFHLRYRLKFRQTHRNPKPVIAECHASPRWTILLLWQP